MIYYNHKNSEKWFPQVPVDGLLKIKTLAIILLPCFFLLLNIHCRMFFHIFAVVRVGSIQ